MIGRLLNRISRPAPRPFADPVRNAGCDELEVDLWELSRFIVERTVPRIGVHPYPLNEQLLMAAAACRLRPTAVFEWGTYIGSSALFFAECARAFDLVYEVHSIDMPPEANPVETARDDRGKLVRGVPSVHLYLGDGVTVALERWSALGRPRRPLFFVDGDHERASVARELDAIFDTVPDASALVHDAFFQSSGSGYNVGPALAVHDAIARRPARFAVFYASLGLPGMALLASVQALAVATRP